VDLILTFATIHEALAAEKAAGETGEMLVPLPPRIKSDCGYGLLVPGAESLEDPRIAALVEAGIRFAGAYRMKEKAYERIG
jgi:hypothetical protein